MSTQIRGSGRRSRMLAVVVALALTLAVVLIATQASSIWSGRTAVQPAMQIASTGGLVGREGYLPPGCRPKYGCQRSGSESMQPVRGAQIGITGVSGSHIPPGCRPKYGCEHDADSAAKP